MRDDKASKCAAILPRLLTVIGAACLLAACLPGYATEQHDDVKATRISVGLPFSPWIFFVREIKEERSPAGTIMPSFNQQMGITFISWSMLLLIVAQLLFYLAARAHKHFTPGQQATSEPNAS
jgi:hypothetical protein